MITLPRPGQKFEIHEGLTAWRNAENGFLVLEIHYTADPARRGDWKHRAAKKYGGIHSWRWKREHEIDWEAQSGELIWPMFSKAVHCPRPFTIPAHWPRWIMIDPGWRNPTSMLWVAVDTDADPTEDGFRPVHVYREFYKPKHSAGALASAAHAGSRTPMDKNGARDIEWIEEIILDPSAKQEHQSAAESTNETEVAATILEQFEARMAELGWDVPCSTGNNLKDRAIEEVAERIGCYWEMPDGMPLVDEEGHLRHDPTDDEILKGARRIEPTFFVHRCCVETIKEIAKYRWLDWASNDVAARHNEQEKPVDKDDHSITNLIRFVNLLRGERGDGGLDLEEFEPRKKPRRWTPTDETMREAHEGAAGRYRRQATRQKRRRR